MDKFAKWYLKQDICRSGKKAKEFAKNYGYVGKANRSTQDHIIKGSRKHNHKWERLSPTKKWIQIKFFLAYAMTYGRIKVQNKKNNVYQAQCKIAGETVQVRYQLQKKGFKAVSDGWIV